MGRIVQVEVPFNAEVLVLDPSCIGSTADSAMEFICGEVAWEDEELEQIMTAAVALKSFNAGTFGECLNTAIVWSRG